MADRDAVKAAARRLVDVIGGSELVADLLPAFSDAIYDAAAADEHLLGDVVGREPVEALFEKLIGMHRLQDRAMDRLTQSPVVAVIASRYVGTLVGEFLQQNRQRAERVPGVSSLMSIGFGAAKRVQGATDQFLGDAQRNATRYAVRQTSSAMRDVIRNAPVQQAAMELWDLHADEPVSALREYLTAQDLRELLAIVHEIVVTARNQDYVGMLLDECIDVFFDRYGGRDVTSVLAELGVTREVVVDELRRLAPPALEAARADGRLAALVRARLEPFFTADSTWRSWAATCRPGRDARTPPDRSRPARRPQGTTQGTDARHCARASARCGTPAAWRRSPDRPGPSPAAWPTSCARRRSAARTPPSPPTRRPAPPGGTAPSPARVSDTTDRVRLLGSGCRSTRPRSTIRSRRWVIVEAETPAASASREGLRAAVAALHGQGLQHRPLGARDVDDLEALVVEDVEAAGQPGHGGDDPLHGLGGARLGVDADCALVLRPRGPRHARTIRAPVTQPVSAITRGPPPGISTHQRSLEFRYRSF